MGQTAGDPALPDLSRPRVGFLSKYLELLVHVPVEGLVDPDDLDSLVDSHPSDGDGLVIPVKDCDLGREIDVEAGTVLIPVEGDQSPGALVVAEVTS
jgi:hypothetical protein